MTIIVSRVTKQPNKRENIVQHFNDNVLNTLKNTRKLIDSVSSQKTKKDMRNIALKTAKRFCNDEGKSCVSKLSPVLIEVLEDEIWCSLEAYGH